MTSPTRSALRQMDRADVYLDDELCGSLARGSNDSIGFHYASTELADAPRVRDRSVAWSLLRNGPDYPVMTTGGAVAPFFAGLLPEGVRLGVVTSSTKTSADDHLTLLMAVGSDTIGNVRVIPAGTTPAGQLPMFKPERDDDFRAVYARLTGSVDEDPVGIAGVQPKVSAAMWSTPTRTAAGPAILKLSPERYPLIAENEHFFMTMAAHCGLRTAATSLIFDAKDRSALLVTRFDRDGAARLAQEDACQVAGLYPASKYRITTEAAITALADACARGGGSRLTATLDLLKLVVFSWLIGNGDLHGKNMSIYHRDGIWQPTPAYDLLSTQPYTGWKDPMALDLYGRANRLTRTNFVDAAERLGVRERATVRMIDAILEAARPWADRCDDIGFPPRHTELLTELLRSRIDGLTR